MVLLRGSRPQISRAEQVDHLGLGADAQGGAGRGLGLSASLQLHGLADESGGSLGESSHCVSLGMKITGEGRAARYNTVQRDAIGYDIRTDAAFVFGVMLRFAPHRSMLPGTEARGMTKCVTFEP